MRALLIGPLPPPINGCAYANLVLLKRAEEYGVSVVPVDTNVEGVSGLQGTNFSFDKVVRFARSYTGLPRVFRADVVYLTPGQTFFGVLKYLPFILVAKLLRRPYVLHVHGNHLGEHYRSLTGLRRRVFRHVISGAAAGIVLSESLRANFAGLLPADRVFVVENFAGDDLFLPGVEKSADRLRVLYLSNLMREKGILELLDALIELQARGVAFVATIAGQMEIGIEAEVRERLDQLRGAVHYVGTVRGEAKRRLLLESNVLVLPTYYAMEGQPISLLEGMATGNIIVTTAHAGIPDVVDSRNGVIVPPRSASALVEALAGIAADLPSQLRLFSTYNAGYAARRFTEAAFGRNVLAVMERVITGSGSSGEISRI